MNWSIVLLRCWYGKRQARLHTCKKLNSQKQSSEASSSALGVSLRLPIRKTLPHIYRNFMTAESGVLYAHARFETKKGLL